MQQKTKKRVFISFHMDDLHAKKLLEAQAKSDKFDLEFINYSVNEPFDEKWKTQCKERMANTSTVICLIGERTWARPAVIWELETAYKLGKKVIGVRIYRDKWHSVPHPITKEMSPVINWNISDISSHL